MKMPASARTLVALTMSISIISIAAAAPLPPFQPVNICGTIVEQAWVPTETQPGRPGFSGSLGHDRTFPAHLRIILEAYSGIDATTAQRINYWLGFSQQPSEAPKRLLLWLPTDNPALLTSVRRLCVEGFSIRGDEGGTWTSFRQVVPAPNSP